MNLSDSIELFSSGKLFEQILFLDDFGNSLDIETISSEDLASFLTKVIDRSENTYLKRTGFKILSNLTLSGKITNEYTLYAILLSFLESDSSELVAIGLKSIWHFPVILKGSRDRLVLLSDHQDGETSSQALFCLGCLELQELIGSNEVNSKNLIQGFERSKVFFLESEKSSENRVDAKFYTSLVSLARNLLLGNIEACESDLKSLKGNLQNRLLYEFQEDHLEFELLLFNSFKNLGELLKALKGVPEWIDIRQSIFSLFTLNAEIEKLWSNHTVSGKSSLDYFRTIISLLEKNNYQLFLASEKLRLNALKKVEEEDRIVQYLNYVIDNLPEEEKQSEQNLELLALLVSSFGQEVGLKVYDKTQNKNPSEAIKLIAQILDKELKCQYDLPTGSIQGMEVLNSIMAQIELKLPNYPSNKREIFKDILGEVIRYTRITVVGSDKKRFPFLYSKSERVGDSHGYGIDAKEQDLQDSMITYFEHSTVASGLDHERARFINGGRVDIVFKWDAVTIPLELKKSTLVLDKETLEDYYIAQAQTYTSGYDQLGIFVVLDLCDKSKMPSPNFKDLFRIHHLEPHHNSELKYPDYVISVILPGNKVSPSSLSTYS